MKSGTVFNIQRFCLHDGDGIRTCVFLKGCHLRCIWCHNPEGLEKAHRLSFDEHKCSSCGRCLTVCSVRTTENGAVKPDREKCIKCGRCVEICRNQANEIIGVEMTVQEVLDEVVKDKMFYDTSDGGLTVTGGEPSYQSEFTLELLSAAREAGINVAIETCGMGTREFYREASDIGTLFLFDVKCIDSELHRKLTGADNAHILSNLNYLMDRGADIIIRIPLVPGCNDSEYDVSLLAQFLNENKHRYRYAEIMPYHALGTGKSEKTGVAVPYVHESATETEISRWCSLFTSFGADIKVSE